MDASTNLSTARGSNFGSWSLALAVLLVLVYWPALNGQPIWDDVNYIFENQALTDPSALSKMWTDARAFPDFWPLSYSTFWLELRVFGHSFFAFHLLNLLFHWVSCILFCRLLLLMKVENAWAATFVFAFHPANVEAVAWIFQTKTTLATVFSLGSCLALLSKGRWQTAAPFIFLCALLAKTSVVFMPVALLVLRMLGERRIQLRMLSVFFLLSLALGIFNIYWYQPLPGSLHEEVVRNDSIWSHFGVAAMAFWFYLSKALVPWNLNFVYPRWHSETVAIYGPIAWFAILTLLVLIRRVRPHIALVAGLSFYAINLIPVLGVYDIYFMRYSFVADHWQYLSLMGFAVAVIQIIASLKSMLLERITRWPLLQSERRYLFEYLLAGIFLLSLGLMAHSQTYRFQDAETIWRDSIRKNPKALLARNELGILLKRNGSLDEAMQQYQAALSVEPQAETYYNMALIYELQNDPTKAVECYLKAYELAPYAAKVLLNLGALEAKYQNFPAAERAFTICIETLAAPDCFYNLGYLKEAKGDLKAAASYYQEALARDPNRELFQSSLSRLKPASGLK